MFNKAFMGVPYLFKGYLSDFGEGTGNTSLRGFNLNTETTYVAGSWSSLYPYCFGASVNSQFYGYMLQGSRPSDSPGSVYATTQGYRYRDETAIVTSATLAVAKYSNPGGLDSPVRGYSLGGVNNSFVMVDSIEGLVFGSHVAIDPGAVLSEATAGISAEFDTRQKGYMTANQTSGSLYSSVIHGFVYATETRTNPSSTLSLARREAASCWNPTYGYIAGGIYDFDGGTFYAYITNIIERFVFSGESISTIADTLATAKMSRGRVQNFTTGYFFGGWYSGVFQQTTEISKFSMSTETDASVSATMANAGQVANSLCSPPGGII